MKTMAEMIADAATTFQEQLTGHVPASVSVVLTGVTLVITLRGVLSPAEQAMAQSPDGAAKVQEFHRELFTTASESLRQEIGRITGVEVRDGAAQLAPASGSLVQAFPTGTVVQVFQLSGKVPPDSFGA